MQKVLLNNGNLIEVENNEAHRIIEEGLGKIYQPIQTKAKKQKRVRNKMQKGYFNKGLRT